ncbi:MAG: amidohydrolase [Chloroflexi bacterium]|nr:amidohydrolase [Chloroflexota bacterium]
MTRSTVRELVEAGQSLKSLPWPVIDAHAHLGPTGGFYIPTPDAASMVGMMDRLGLACTGISPHLAITSDYRRGNDLAAETVRRFPGRFFGYVTVNPHYAEDVLPELQRGFEELGLVAIKLHPTLHDFAVSDERCEPIWHFAEQRGAAILCHTWEGDKRCSPTALGEIAAAHPQAHFLLGHSGGTPAGRREAVRVAQQRDNVYLELCGSTLTSAEVEWMVGQVGPKRILFGTDSPWIDPRFPLGKVAFAELDDTALQYIMGGNIARLVHLPL